MAVLKSYVLILCTLIKKSLKNVFHQYLHPTWHFVARFVCFCSKMYFLGKLGTLLKKLKPERLFNIMTTPNHLEVEHKKIYE